MKLLICFLLLFGHQVTDLHGLILEDELVKYLAGEIKFEIKTQSPYAGMHSEKVAQFGETPYCEVN